MNEEQPFGWLGLFAALSGAGAVAVLAAGVDMRLSAAARSFGPGWLHHAEANWTALGSLAVLALVVAAAAGFLWVRRQPHLAALLVAAAFFGEAAVEILKAAVDRARPAPDGALATFGASFPSGHAMMAAMVYLTLGAMLARAEDGRGTRRLIVGVAIGVTVLVGLTRVALGAHWPSDVLAGWSLGAAWAWMTARFALRLQRIGRAEPPG